jgi:hypothetical protein
LQYSAVLEGKKKNASIPDGTEAFSLSEQHYGQCPALFDCVRVDQLKVYLAPTVK